MPTRRDKIIYARGFPYGAPLFIIRGGGTKAPDIQAFLKGNGFQYEGKPTYGWKSYADADDAKEILGILEEEYDCLVLAKKTMDENYILDGFTRRQA